MTARIDTGELRRRSAPVNEDTMLTVPSWFVLITEDERDVICDELEQLRAENTALMGDARL